MLTKIKSIVAAIGILAGSTVLAHGENKPGPHQGYVRMPGAFHTEVVPAGDEFKVYLLDMGFRNPTVANSAVHAQVRKVDNGVAAADCTVTQDFFSCKLPKGTTLQNGTLELKASRLGEPSIPVQYRLPLQFSDIAH